MLKNYYYLNRTVAELNRVLQNVKVVDIYSQEKNSLLLSIPSDDKPFRNLFISTNPSLPYLVVKENHHKAKRNVLQFNIKEIPQTLLKIEISENDRIIRIVLEKIELVFSIMGGKTNIYFIQDGKIIDELRKGKGDEWILTRISNTKFTSEFVFHEINEEIFENFDVRKIKAKYSFIPKEIINEMKLRYKDDKNYRKLFHLLLEELYLGSIKIYASQDEGKIKFVPYAFKSFISENGVSYDNCSSAIHEYLKQHFRYVKINNLKKIILKELQKELERTANRLNNLKGRIDKGERSSEYYNYGNILSVNRYLLKPGQDKIILNDFNTGKEIEIKLNPKKKPQENIDAYFEKARDEKINFKKSTELYSESLDKFKRLKEIEDAFNNSDRIDDYLRVKDELKIRDKKEKKKKVIDGAKLREFILDGKYKVLVGRDSKSNDMLSIKIAKQNDYWFHARGLPGSHVVLRVENTKEGVPKNILKNVAQIAAFYSKAKTAGTAPVSYTLAKFVRKKKGMEPGKVLIEKEKVLLVRPGIPNNVEMITDE